MRQFVLILFLFLKSLAFGQLSLHDVVRNSETENDTCLSDCFKNRLDDIYKFSGSPRICIGDPHFFPVPKKTIWIRDSSDLEMVIEELPHAFQWKQKGGKFRLVTAAGCLYLKAAWLSLWRKNGIKMTLWQRYADFAYGPMNRKFWAYEYEAHQILVPDMWKYLGCNDTFSK